jgi:hypothetical protein
MPDFGEPVSVFTSKKLGNCPDNTVAHRHRFRDPAVAGRHGGFIMPIAISAALHDAIACTVCRWLWTKNHFGTVTSAKPGSIRTTCGTIDAKYGTRAIAAVENRRVPPGRPARRFHILYVVVTGAMAGYLTRE